MKCSAINNKNNNVAHCDLFEVYTDVGRRCQCGIRVVDGSPTRQSLKMGSKGRFGLEIINGDHSAMIVSEQHRIS